jgi:Lrp/AsnC family transcriptional regulator for asnA, asnC and gidA
LKHLDKIDQEILTQLLIKPQKPFLKISEELGISPMTVKIRYEKMKKVGLIMGTSIMLDLSKIGFQGKAFLHITKSDDQNPEMLIETLNQIPNVFLVTGIIGAFDILVMLAFRDLTDVKEVIDRIRAESCVEKVETSISNDTFYPVTKDFAKIRLFQNTNRL